MASTKLSRESEEEEEEERAPPSAPARPLRPSADEEEEAALALACSLDNIVAAFSGLGNSDQPHSSMHFFLESDS